MYTTMKGDSRVKAMLDKLKIFSGESYNDVILDLIENYLPLDARFKESIEHSINEYRKGEVYSLEDIISSRKQKRRGRK